LETNNTAASNQHQQVMKAKVMQLASEAAQVFLTDHTTSTQQQPTLKNNKHE